LRVAVEADGGPAREVAVAAVLGCSVATFVAVAVEQRAELRDRGEAAILFCFVFLYIAAAGPGAWAIDSRRSAD